MTKRFNLSMIVDDSEIDSFILRRVMEAGGFCEEIINFSRAKIALDHLHEIDRKGGEIPDIIFLDLNMPVMDGFGFLDSYQLLSAKIKKHTKIVVVTSSNHQDDRERARSSKYVLDYFVKPVTHDHLNKILFESSLLESHETFRHNADI